MSYRPTARTSGQRKVRPRIRTSGKPFQAACERAGVKNLRIHDLRHMATSILFMDGIPEAIIKKLTGHRSIKR